MHNLLLVYFVNLYMFRAYLCPSSGGTTIYIYIYIYNNLYLLLFLDNCLLSWLDCCIHTVASPDDGFRYARNMNRLTKYTKNKLCIKLAILYTTFTNLLCHLTYLHS
jgi:hypothetical protein